MQHHRQERPREARGAAACLAGVAVVLVMAGPGAVSAQEARFGIAPAASTQRAISDPPAQSSREQDGVYAALGVAYTERSNVRREPGGGESDAALVVTPEAHYKRALGRHGAEIGLASRITRYDDLSRENTEDHSIDGLVNLDITRILDLDLFGSYTDAAEPRGGSGTRLDQGTEPDQVNITSYGGVFTLGRRIARLQIEAGADRTRWHYQNNRQAFRDRSDDRVHGRVYYNISPRTSVFAGADLTRVDYTRGAGPDSEELGFEAGGRWDVTARTTGRLSVGRAQKNFEDPALDTAEATTLAGRLSWTPRPRTTFSLYGSRQFEESTAAGDDFYISELIGASISQSFGPRWNAFAYMNRTNDEFEEGRNDEIMDYGLGVDYELGRRLSLGARYSVIRRDSSVAGNDFKDEIITLFIKGNMEIAR